jgi:hypothetical protein
VLSVLKRLEDTNVTATYDSTAFMYSWFIPSVWAIGVCRFNLNGHLFHMSTVRQMNFAYDSTAVMYSWFIPSVWAIGVCCFNFNGHLFHMSNVRQMYISLDACEEAICLRGSCAMFKQAGDNQFVLNGQQLALMYH